MCQSLTPRICAVTSTMVEQKLRHSLRLSVPTAMPYSQLLPDGTAAAVRRRIWHGCGRRPQPDLRRAAATPTEPGPLAIDGGPARVRFRACGGDVVSQRSLQPGGSGLAGDAELCHRFQPSAPRVRVARAPQPDQGVGAVHERTHVSDQAVVNHTVASVRTTANEASAMRLTPVPPLKVSR